LFRRNEEAANRIISELKSFQPDGELTFIKKDLTLLQSVDEVCEEVKAKEKKLNLLFMSQGTMSLKGRDGT
jgi:NAD(P)-dependent dehydrogenase (short-subunit alcohol dehydrogenase family)